MWCNRSPVNYVVVIKNTDPAQLPGVLDTRSVLREFLPTVSDNTTHPISLQTSLVLNHLPPWRSQLNPGRKSDGRSYVLQFFQLSQGPALCLSVLRVLVPCKVSSASHIWVRFSWVACVSCRHFTMVG